MNGIFNLFDSYLMWGIDMSHSSNTYILNQLFYSGNAIQQKLLPNLQNPIILLYINLNSFESLKINKQNDKKYNRYNRQSQTMTEHLQTALDNQIKKRINHDSPSKYDLDFYSRKITRLENDNNDMHEELSKLRIRLRRAQDFQLKYELLLKQLCTLQSDIDQKDKQLGEAKSKLEQIQMNIKEKQTKSMNWQSKLMEMQNELNRWRQRAEQAEQSKTQIILEIKDKQTLQVKRQIETSRRQFNDKEEEYQFQIRSLRKIVDEKQNVETVVKNRVEKVRQQKDEQINRLRQNMDNLKSECKLTLQEKNNEIQLMKEKFEKLFNFQLQNIHKSQQDEAELFNIQMNGLRQLIGIKNDQIQRLLRELRQANQQTERQRDQLNEQINILKEQIYKIERQNEIQLYALKQRLTKVHAQDIEEMQNRFKNIIEAMKTQRKQLEQFINQKDKILQSEHKQLQRIKADYIDRLKQRQSRIEQLMDRIKTAGDINDREVKDLHQSFHKIQSEKQVIQTEYQANVGFLNNQIVKQTAMNESKNDQIKKLHEEISRIKKEYNAVILQIEGRWKQERKQWQQSRQQDRRKFEQLQEKLRQKEREWRAKQKQLQRQIDKCQRQNKKLEFIIKQMQADADRLNQYIKQLDDALKRQYKKNQMGTLDNAGIRRELTAELDRQKNQLEAISRMQIDQAKRKMDNQMIHLKNENQKLQTDLVKKNIQCQNLQDELKRLASLNKNIEIINRQKLVQYEKKMATLNQEINLTQNLYQAFLQSKARSSKGLSG